MVGVLIIPHHVPILLDIEHIRSRDLVISAERERRLAAEILHCTLGICSYRYAMHVPRLCLFPGHSLHASVATSMKSQNIEKLGSYWVFR